ncbi:MAG TPA: hypothetical protein VE825_08970 [Terriglobales bacterium]|jgi:hypothetical protein|nr:hypothetical protein [Terriglobales bacterium]
MNPAFAWSAALLLTAGVLFYIFYFQEDVHAAPEKTRLAYLLERKEVVYDNLRDLNFEYRAGKFPDADYQAMKASLEMEAAGVLAEIDRLESQALRRK